MHCNSISFFLKLFSLTLSALILFSITKFFLVLLYFIRSKNNQPCPCIAETSSFLNKFVFSYQPTTISNSALSSLKLLHILFETWSSYHHHHHLILFLLLLLILYTGNDLNCILVFFTGLFLFFPHIFKLMVNLATL